MTDRWGAGLVLAVVAVLVAGDARAETRLREVRFDVYAFSQEDEPGQELKNEGLTYVGGRPAFTIELSPTVTLHASGALGVISNEEAATLPATTGAMITSASARVLAMDASLGLEIHRPGSPWTFRPGAYYHHQIGYVGEGIDFGVERELSGGDTILSATFNLRVAFPKVRTWDGFDFGRDLATNHSLTLGWKQNVSPSVLAYVSAQYSRADGVLDDSYNYVVLYQGDVPVTVQDEVLPGSRNRLQTNARIRWSPRVGVALGMDASRYVDDWSIRHWSWEPSVAGPLPGRASGRLWVRFSDQRAAEFFSRRPSSPERFQTQDSDLGEFTMVSAGTALSFPFGAEGWEGRLSLFGFDRSDGMQSAGGDLGVVRGW